MSRLNPLFPLSSLINQRWWEEPERPREITSLHVAPMPIIPTKTLGIKIENITCPPEKVTMKTVRGKTRRHRKWNFLFGEKSIKRHTERRRINEAWAGKWGGAISWMIVAKYKGRDPAKTWPFRDRSKR